MGLQQRGAIQGDRQVSTVFLEGPWDRRHAAVIRAVLATMRIRRRRADRAALLGRCQGNQAVEVLVAADLGDVQDERMNPPEPSARWLPGIAGGDLGQPNP